MSTDGFTPNGVGVSFITQYYQTFGHNPSELFQFYRADSHFSFSENSQVEAAPVLGSEAIRRTMQDLNFGNEIDLTEGTLDVQKSDTGIILLVTGNLTFNLQSHRFVQSFFLAEQNSKRAPYYVRNSVLRLLDSVPVVVSVPEAVEEEIPIAVPEEQELVLENDPTIDDTVDAVLEVEEEAEEEVVEEVEVVEIEVEVETAPVEQEEQDPEPQEEDAPVEQQPEIPPVQQEPEPILRQPAAPSSYAAMVQKKGAAPVAAPSARARTYRNPPAAAPEVASGVAKADSHRAPRDGSAATATSGGYNSIYVSKIPDETTSEDLIAVFSAFGGVTAADLGVSKKYAFVELDSAATMQAILAAPEGSLQIRGAALKVDARNSKPPARRSRGPSGVAAPAGAAKTEGNAGAGGPRAERSPRSTSGGGRPERTEKAPGNGSPRGDRPPRERSPRNADAGEGSPAAAPKGVQKARK